MKRNQVNAILVDQSKRRNTIVSYICSIVLVSFIALTFFVIYINKNKVQYVKYDENSKIDYKVFLKENKYFEDNYLGKDNQYISTLIDYINADFEYDLSLEEKDINYKYSYRIEAEVNVLDKDTKNPLIVKKQELLTSNERDTYDKNVKILESLKIDYNYYNDLIKGFVSEYGLDSVESILKVSMYVNVIGSCEEFDDNTNNESAITLTIPLTTKTVAIDLSNDLVKTEDNVMICKSPSPFNSLFIILATISIIVDLILIYQIVRYEIKTRSAENIYEKELKKILNNYRSYIQKVNNQFDVTGYQPMKIDTFTDLLEIRDTIQQPILMVENENKQGVYFIIPSNTKILYMYGLKVSDIKKQMEKNTNIMDKSEFQL